MGGIDRPRGRRAFEARDERDVYCSGRAFGKCAKVVPLSLVACWKPAISRHLALERLMRRMYGSLVGKVLVFIAGIFLALTMSGCNDPAVAEIKAEHRRMGNVCQQELRQGLAGFPPTTQAPMFRPAP